MNVLFSYSEPEQQVDYQSSRTKDDVYGLN